MRWKVEYVANSSCNSVIWWKSPVFLMTIFGFCVQPFSIFWQVIEKFMAWRFFSISQLFYPYEVLKVAAWKKKWGTVGFKKKTNILFLKWEKLENTSIFLICKEDDVDFNCACISFRSCVNKKEEIFNTGLRNLYWHSCIYLRSIERVWLRK